MRKSILFLFVSVFVFGQIFGQNKKYDWSVGLHGGTQEYLGDIGNEFWSFDQHGAYGLSLTKYLTPFWDLGGLVTYSFLNHADSISGFEVENIDVNLFAKLKGANGKWLKEESKLNPFLIFGLGDAFTISDDYVLQTTGNMKVSGDFNLFGGLGLEYRVNDRLSVNVMSKYTYLWTDNIDNRTSKDNNYEDQYLTHTAGLSYNLAGGKDQDNDGIKDRADECPTVAGVEALNGCPDKDGDMITDAKDECPTVAGLAKFNGCPDKDNDGVIDSKDACPDVAGTLNGCPDSDGDGVADKDDNCPTVKGLVAMKGCPDSDGDGVVDDKDKCVDVKGPAANNGCPYPDTDKDGVLDKDDKCPTVFGIAANKGCPEVKAETQQVMSKAMEGVFFETGSDKIKAKSYSKLDNVVKALNENQVMNLDVSGYTDNKGDDNKNLELSKRRADAVKTYLISKGVDSSRINANGYGEADPRETNDTAKGREKNRRVEFKINF